MKRFGYGFLLLTVNSMMRPFRIVGRITFVVLGIIGFLSVRELMQVVSSGEATVAGYSILEIVWAFVFPLICILLFPLCFFGQRILEFCQEILVYHYSKSYKPKPRKTRYTSWRNESAKREEAEQEPIADEKDDNLEALEALFKGTTTEQDLLKRYKDLIKIYHPDNQAGDTSMTQAIQNIYERLMVSQGWKQAAPQNDNYYHDEDNVEPTHEPVDEMEQNEPVTQDVTTEQEEAVIKINKILDEAHDCFFDHKKYRIALMMYRKAFRINKKVFGKTSHNSIIIYTTIADVYFQQEKYAKTKMVLNKMMRIALKLDSGNGINVADTYLKFANFYETVGKYSEAIDALQNALEIYESQNVCDYEFLDSISNDIERFEDKLLE